MLIVPFHFSSHYSGARYSDDDGADPVDLINTYSDQKKKSKVLQQLRELYVNRVRAEQSTKARSLGTDEPHLKLIINPDISSSWLDPPSTADEPAGQWPKNTKFPSASGTMPKEMKKNNPSPLSTYYAKKEFRDFFEAPKWVDASRKVDLDASIFPGACCSWPTDNTAPQIDKFLRQELNENFVTDELLALCKDLADYLKEITSISPAQMGAEDLASIKSKSALLADTIQLASASNLRGRNSILTTFAYNKTAARREVLDSHSGGSGFEHVKNALKHTNFFNAGIFGPTPKNLESTISRNNRSDYILKPKPRPTRDSYKPNSTPQPSSSAARQSYPSTRHTSPRPQPQKRPSSKQGFRGNDSNNKKQTQRNAKTKHSGRGG